MSDAGEAQPRRRRRPAPPARPATQGSVARGVALVVVALVIGVLLLRDDDSASTQVAIGTDGSGEAVDGSGDVADGDELDEDPEAPATPDTEPVRPPSEVKVLVANGSGVNGAAGGATDALEALNYVTGTPTDARERVPATAIYFTEGYQPEAEALAEAIGAPATAVTPIPPVAPVDDLQLANILVVLGPDLAAG